MKNLADKILFRRVYDSNNVLFKEEKASLSLDFIEALSDLPEVSVSNSSIIISHPYDTIVYSLE